MGTQKTGALTTLTGWGRRKQCLGWELQAWCSGQRGWHVQSWSIVPGTLHRSYDWQKSKGRWECSRRKGLKVSGQVQELATIEDFKQRWQQQIMLEDWLWWLPHEDLEGAQLVSRRWTRGCWWSIWLIYRYTPISHRGNTACGCRSQALESDGADLVFSPRFGIS